jgi:phage terminase large subunit-like protein
MGHITKMWIKHRSGGISTIDVMTHEQDNMAFEGWSGHWVWFDEPPPHEKYVACLRGLIDFGGRCWLTLTPISEPWIYDEIVGSITPDRVWYITVDIRDNPFLSEKNIQDFEASLSPEEKDARIHGKFIHLAGRIYKSLDTELHVIQKMPVGHSHWPKWFVLDPADRRPHHGIWFTMDPMNTMYVYDEIVFKGTIKELCKQIKDREQTNGVKSENVIRILDPNKGKTPTAVTGLKLVEEFAINEVYFTCNVNDDLSMGHLAVMQALEYDKTRPISSTNSPKLYFYKSNTHECVKQMLMYSWEDWRDKSTKSEKEKPKDLYKDMPDCVRYGVMSRPMFYRPDYNESLQVISPTTGYIRR